VTGADLQWWHFVIVLATMLVFVVVFAWQSAAWQAERDRRIDGYKATPGSPRTKPAHSWTTCHEPSHPDERAASDC
jgi:hypothetical protein